MIEYANHHQPGGLGATVIGGHVYRGRELAQFSGSYVFGDYLVAAAYGGPQRLQIREDVIAAASALYARVSGVPPS